MKQLLVVVVLFVLAAPASAQVQALEVKSFDTVAAAKGELQYAAAPVALIPAFVKRTGSGAFEMMSWVTIAAPSTSGSCMLSAAATSTPVFGSGNSCSGSGFSPTLTGTIYNSWAAGQAALDAKSELHQQGCILMREPGQQAFTWMSTNGRVWLVCQETNFSYSCGG